jgi:hypothetical protein
MAKRKVQPTPGDGTYGNGSIEEGLENALSEMPRSGAPRKLAVEDEAMLCALVCSAPPSRRARWTLQLLADEMVRLTVHGTN